MNAFFDLGGKFFLSSYARKLSVVFKTVFFSHYSRSSISSLNVLGGDLFLENLSSISVSDLYSR